jgi:hypothetical protein
MPSGVRHSVRGVRRRILEVPFRDLADPFAILLSDELTHEAEDALTEEAKNPPPDTGPAGFHQHLRPPHPGRQGLE